MESISAYSRDLFEVKAFLLDHGFKKAVEVLDNEPQSIQEQIIASAFSIQRERDRRPARRGLTLFTKIRTEMGLSAEEFAVEVSKFHSQDLSAQLKSWRVRQDAYARESMRPSDYKMWKSSVFVSDQMNEWEKANPQPTLQKITLADVMLIESTRPHRESRRSSLVDLFERFFEAKTGYKLSWEQLLAEVGPRDPRAAQEAYLQKKQKAKQMPDASDTETLSEPFLAKTLRDIPPSGEVISDGA